MARHNREGQGVDQCGFPYRVSFQPDWLKHVKVTRTLETGRQSTKTLFRNPADRKEGEPGERVRTRVVSREQGLDFEVGVNDRRGTVIRIRVACEVVNEDGEREEVEFTLEDKLPPPLA